jgi:hypothetical protein
MAEFIISGYHIREKAPFLYPLYTFAAVGLGTLNFYWFWLMIKSVAARFVPKSKSN